jgi:hypothetical protein
VVGPPPYSRAELFYMGWEVETYTSQTPEDVRRHPITSVVIHDPAYASMLVDWLRLTSLSPNPDRRPNNHEDARLVIDLYRQDGDRVTYYASRFNLLSEDSSVKRPIDAEFRKAFEFQWVPAVRSWPPN